MQVHAEIASIVRPVWCAVEPVVVIARAEALDEPLRSAAAHMRTAAEPTEVSAAVRSMYRHVGIDPTKTRPSSESLLRRVRRGDPLPRVNSLVDVINWCSLESQLPFGLYDLDRIRGAVTLRLGRPGEEYPGIRKDAVHLAGRLALVDDAGPFGNPTSDSARTMVTVETTRALIVIFAPASIPETVASRALDLTRARAQKYC